MTELPSAESPAVSPERLVVQAVMKTDVGLVRSENQDFGTYTTPSEERESHPGGRLFLVADGMGGHRGGATASRLAGETVKAQYLGSEDDDIGAALRDALARANARIFTEAQANPDLRGMGTTTSALVVRSNNAWFAHVGDSRIYLIRDGAIKQLTEDHSLVASMVREGLLTSTEAENHPRRNVLQRSMGVGEDVEIDVRGPFPVQEGDIFILCSDGLHGLVKEPELLEIATTLPLESAANEYVRRALDRGAPDNVTVIVARIIRPDELTDDTVIDRARETTKKVAVVEESMLDETQPLETSPELEQTVRVRAGGPPRRKGFFRWLFGDTNAR
ncbi:MAG TPA: Stp1/IreP family PP2C-type Ser/Thr phosphatase [Thermoanaerobaculia bacterium]|nr:Stp1/IreP family PP2C-type Ser/Thr phosphatase [Thermoanaerobaculia bacterium]